MSVTSRQGAALGPAQLSLFGDVPTVPFEPALSEHSEPNGPPPQMAWDPDAHARAFAVDPRNNVVLEASAGTGKTSVLVDRYINLLKAGVDPANILAITFTRKAAAEMRDRILGELRAAATRSQAERTRWIELRDRLNEISISTIDAFCLSLLREFPLEADLDPGFGMADETEIPRLIDEALDRSLRILTAHARNNEDIALVLAQLGMARTREGLASLLDRRLVAWNALDRFLARGPSDLDSRTACRRAVVALHDVLRTIPRGLAAFIADGPTGHPRFQLFVRDLEHLGHVDESADGTIRGVLDRIAAHFLTLEGKARRSGQLPPYRASDYLSPESAKRHRAAVFQIAPLVEDVMFAFKRDLNAILARGIRRMFAIALEQYRRALDNRSVLDFSDVLERALRLLRQMDEFAQSRYRLEGRYHHVLVDEFQDTSRAQWELVSLLIQSWGEGLSLGTQPSIFVVGDRKQSIYRFRDAEVSVLQEAGRYIDALRPGGGARKALTRSFRSVPELLQFVNDVFAEVVAEPPSRADDFSYVESDRFPIEPSVPSRRGPVLGIAVADDPAVCAQAVAVEVERILREDTVRDRNTGVPRKVAPGDIAILFRSRASHREFEQAFERRGIPTYVYKGLGFFDADETKDLTSLIRYLANPASNLRAAAFLRSRFVRISDAALAILAPHLASALIGSDPLPDSIGGKDREVLELARKHVGVWLSQVDRVPPADLIEQILRDSAYAYEIRGPRRVQAWENLKKMRGLARRIQNRGYATLTRMAEHIDSLTAGDESNAVVEAMDAVNLMTVHASKGLEFPIVFVVNMAKGASGFPKPMRIVARADEEPSVSIGPFVSDMDEAERSREKHETKRLLYVALTRARDRLYFSAVLKDGALAPGRGSLAEVLPASISNLFVRASSAFPECPAVAWASSAGHTFEFSICRAPSAPLPETVLTAESESSRPAVFGPSRIAETRMKRQAVTAQSDVSVGGHSRMSSSPEAGVGRLLHTLITATARLDAASPDEQVVFARSCAQRVDAERGLSSEDSVVAALERWRRFRSRPELVELVAAGEIFHEVPFSLRDEGRIVRGSIDCLIRQRDGKVTVLDFKSGGPRPDHEIQLDMYLRAARSIFPDAVVEGRLVYL
jgi:ATP-dependent helicase/nuclease subunit A